jgi:16S rRNA (guanine527-N7)-methyltransferase
MQQAAQLFRFLDELEQWNKRLNLISYRDREELDVKHVQDSLSLLEVFELEKGQRVLDLGAGGGFPGIPLAILSPETAFVLMDSVGKKMAAVQAMIEALVLKNVQTVAGRFEDLAHANEYREAFGMVVARAVAPLPTLLEYAAGFVCVNGVFVAYKSAEYAEELKASLKAQNLLGLTFEGAIDYELAGGRGSRSLLVFRKTKALSSKYPRKTGVPKKSPL